MIKLSNDINKAEQEIIEAKRLTASNPDNWNVPKNLALTGRQAYIQFCYRMAKFDMEFAHLDPVIASSWLNTGVTRLCHEFEKRLLANPGDRSAYVVFKPYISEKSCVKHSVSPANEPYEYVYNEPAGTNKFLPEAIHIYAKPKATFDNTKPGEAEKVPTWWPYTLNSVNNKWEPLQLKMGYLEIDGPDEANQPFWLSNSFSELQNGMFSKFWVKRDPPGFPIHIYTNTHQNLYRGNNGFINQGAVPNLERGTKDDLLTITSVGVLVYDYVSFLTNSFIDTASTTPINLPAEYHHDIVDYAIDAYFESMFFHQFGKYSMKQARQDADGGTASQSGSRQQKLDAVPPQRYKVGANA